MFRKTMLFATLATTLAAGAAFAGQTVTGLVTRINAPQGDIWVDGRKFDVGTNFASGILKGDEVSVVYDAYTRDVISVTTEQ